MSRQHVISTCLMMDVGQRMSWEPMGKPVRIYGTISGTKVNYACDSFILHSGHFIIYMLHACAIVPDDCSIFLYGRCIPHYDCPIVRCGHAILLAVC